MLLKLVLGFHRLGSSYSKRGKPNEQWLFTTVLSYEKARQGRKKSRGREGRRGREKEKEGSKRSPKIP